MSGNEPPGVRRSTRPSSDAVALGALAPAGSFRDTRTDAMDAWWGERGGREASTARDPTRFARGKKARGKGTRLARENPLPAGRTSRRERKPSLWMAVWCTKISSEPSSGVMKPKPFWVLNHLTCARDGEAGERSGGSGKIHRFTRQRARADAFTVIP